jgi:peptidoglycan/LPS O-acetylase OafA/YrhL
MQKDMRPIASTDSASSSSSQDELPATNPPACPSRELTRFPVLDGLRGFAAVGVALVHYSLGPSLRFPGVARIMDFWEMSPICLDSFLILSGFLIGTGLLATKGSPTYYRRFYRRRIFRILPVYYS